MAVGAGEVVAAARGTVAVEGATTAEAEATEKATGAKGRATALAGEIGRAAVLAAAMLGPLATDAPGVERTVRGGEVRCTHGQKE